MSVFFQGSFCVFYCYTPCMRKISAAGLAITSLLLAATPVFAAETSVTPIQSLSSDQYTILSQYQESADGTVEGAGARLRIRYSSSAPLNGYIAILDASGSYNPANMDSFPLFADRDGTAILDLRVLPGWTPFTHQYYLSFLSSASQTDTQFSNMTVVPGTFLDTIAAGFLHFSVRESYWVSSAHFLHGYNIYGYSFAGMLGCLMIVSALVVVLWKRSLGIPVVITILIVGFLVYDARMAIDLTRLSVAHLHEWITQGTYSQAGDLYTVADRLKKEVEMSKKPAAISVCFSSTDYYAKLLRYEMYPIPVALTGTLLPQTTHVVVSHDLHAIASGGVLHCGGINHAANLVASYPDGTKLYSLTAP